MRAGSSVAEQPPLKRLVGGSTPPRPTIPKVMSDTLDRLAEQLYLAAGVSDIVWARTNPSVRAFYRRSTQAVRARGRGSLEAGMDLS
jgi:hypothetical protein